MRECRANCPKGAVLHLQRNPESVRGTGTEQAFGAALRNPAIDLRNEHAVSSNGPTEHRGARLNSLDDPRATVEMREARERVRAAIERESEGRDAAAVDRDLDRRRVDVGGRRDGREQLDLQRMGREPIPGRLVATLVAEEQEPRMFPGACVLDRRRGRTGLEVGFDSVRLREQSPHDLELLGSAEMRRARDRDLAVVEVGARTNEWEHLQRLRGRPEEHVLPRIARLGDDRPVVHSDGVHGVRRLDDAPAHHFDLDRIRHCRETTPMPELPEVEAWVRELDSLVAGAPVERVPPAHIATVKTFEPPLHSLQGRSFAGARRRGKNLLLPTADRALVLRVHLMSAGRLRYHGPGAKTPKTPMFRLVFADGGELVLTEAGKKKRAGVWLLTPEGLEAELAHLGPDALGLGSERLGEILGRERRQLHPLLRDQRALAGIGRAHANEILWVAQLSPFKLSTDLSEEEIARLAAAIEDDLSRALALREAGKGDAAVYRIHGRFGEPCPLGHDTLRRVAFEEHTITYCPTCQTGGKELKDRRLSRLLR